MRLSKLSRMIYLFVCIGIVVIFSNGYVRAEEQCVKDAWAAFNKKDYKGAIKSADICIENFAKGADKVQEQLNKNKEPIPPTGAVSAADKSKIFGRGLLNDVATAYFIKGRAAEYLYQKGGASADKYKDIAQKAYESACRYKHGRTWDPKGWFWSPCEASSERLPLK